MVKFYLEYHHTTQCQKHFSVSVDNTRVVSKHCSVSVDNTGVVSHWTRFDLLSVSESQGLTQTMKSNWHICAEDLELIFRAETLFDPNYDVYQCKCVGAFYIYWIINCN